MGRSTYWNAPDASILAVRYHLALLLPVDEVVVVLHRNELVPAIGFGDVIERLEFPRWHLSRGHSYQQHSCPSSTLYISNDLRKRQRLTYRACANVSHPSVLNNIIQSLHSLLPRGLQVLPLDQEDVDVCAEALDAGLDGIEDVFAGQAQSIHISAVVVCCGKNLHLRLSWSTDGPSTFGDDDNALARDLIGCKGLADDLLRHAVRVEIGLKRDDRQHWASLSSNTILI